jgi:hypothetical protein
VEFGGEMGAGDDISFYIYGEVEGVCLSVGL